MLWSNFYVISDLRYCLHSGDRYLKPWIIPDPEVTVVQRAREDECLILASDGLWDVMSNEEACDAARRRILLWHKKNGATATPCLIQRGEEADPAAQAAADYLSKLAIQKGSKDNISVIVVDLKAQRKFKSKAWHGKWSWVGLGNCMISNFNLSFTFSQLISPICYFSCLGLEGCPKIICCPVCAVGSFFMLKYSTFMILVTETM